MVLWEISLATAYFLGLKRTYRLALKIQRRLVSTKRPKIRGFLHRRTRAIFDVALTVHRNIQQRDIEVGRNVGNWILRWLDRMKPSAQIRNDPPKNFSRSDNKTMKIVSNFRRSFRAQEFRPMFINRGSDTRTFGVGLFPISFPTLSMMVGQAKAPNINIQCRYFSPYPTKIVEDGFRTSKFGGVFRDDIAQWMKVRPR